MQEATDAEVCSASLDVFVHMLVAELAPLLSDMRNLAHQLVPVLCPAPDASHWPEALP